MPAPRHFGREAEIQAMGGIFPYTPALALRLDALFEQRAI